MLFKTRVSFNLINKNIIKSDIKAFAIPTVLGLALFLSILAVTLLNQFSSQTPMSDMKYDRLRAHFLALGGIQIALLKVKHLPREFYSAMINYDLYEKMDTSEKALHKHYKDAYHAFLDLNFNWKSAPSDQFTYASGAINNYYLGNHGKLGYYDPDNDKADYIRFISIEPMGTRPMLETGIDTGYYEDDLFKIKFQGHCNGIIDEVTQTIKLTRQVILN